MSVQRPGEADDHLGLDPRSSLPSAIPGITQLEFDQIAENILWYAACPPGAKIRLCLYEYKVEII